MSALEKITKSLKHIKNLRPVMINLHKGISTGSAKITGFKTTVWASLLAVCIVNAVCSSADSATSLHSTPSTSTTPYKRSLVQKICH